MGSLGSSLASSRRKSSSVSSVIGFSSESSVIRATLRSWVLYRVLSSLFPVYQWPHTFSLKLQFPKASMIIIDEDRYSINIQVAVGYNLQFIDIATGVPWSIHDSWVLRHTAEYQKPSNEVLLELKVNVSGHQMGRKLLRDGINSLSKWLLKPYIFSLSLSFSPKEKLEQKFIFSKSNCGGCICDTKIERDRLINNACQVQIMFPIRLLHILFCTTSSRLTEKSISKATLYTEIMNQGHTKHRKRYHSNSDVLHDGEGIRTISKIYRNEM